MGLHVRGGFIVRLFFPHLCNKQVGPDVQPSMQKSKTTLRVLAFKDILFCIRFNPRTASQPVSNYCQLG